jgi:hypothetical protein
MKPVVAPITIDNQGAAVANLHMALDILGYTVYPAEKEKQVFGGATAELIINLQKTYQLDTNGGVDEPTAALINKLLKEKGVLDDDLLYTVRGYVQYAEGAEPAPQWVRAYDKDLRNEELLGEVQPDPYGHYVIRYSAEQFRRAEKKTADLRISVCDADRKEIVSSSIVFNAGRDETINLALSQSLPLSEYEYYMKELAAVLDGVALYELKDDGPPERNEFDFVAGDTGIPRQRITWLVQAALLERETATGEGGIPGMSTHLPANPQPGNIPAVIFYGWFRQHLPTSITELLQQETSSLREALEQSVQENIIPFLIKGYLDAIIDRLRALKAKLALVTPVDGQATSLGDLLDTAVKEPVKKLAVAALYTEHNGVLSHELWNAINENKALSAEEAGLVRLTLQLGDFTSNHLPLVTVLQQMILKEQIPIQQAYELRPFAARDASEWKTILQKRQADGLPVGVPPGTPGKDTEEQVSNYAVTLTQYMANLLPTPVITHRLVKDNGDDSPFNETRHDLQVFFTNNPSFEFRDTPVEKYLKEDVETKLAGVKDTATLKTQLKNMQRVFNITPRYEEIRKLLADDMHSAFMMVQLGKRHFIEKYADHVGGLDRAAELYRKAEDVHVMALTIYMKNAKAFNSALPYVITGGNSAKAPGTGDAELVSLFGSYDLCACQHCRSLYSPAAYLVDILKFLNDGPVKDGLTPLQVLLGRRPDLEHIALTCHNINTELPYVDLVNEIMERAIASRSFSLDAAPDSNAVLTDLRAERIPAFIRQALADQQYVLTDHATVRSNRSAGAVTGNPEWILLDRGWVFVLRYYGESEGFGIDPWPQTSWTKEELRANPEHTQDAAYELLRNAVYPWSLPLYLPLEEVRVYLQHLGVPRYKLMETFFTAAPSGMLADNSIAYEYLGLDLPEVAIIAGLPIANTNAWDYWGLNETANAITDPFDGTAPLVRGNWDVVLQRVSIFVQQSGLTYKELLELLGAWFINPAATGGRLLGIVSTDTNDPATCHLSKLSIEVVDNTMSPANKKAALINAWNRIHRFVRLWRKTGWSMRELDKVITALQPADANGQPFITENFLLQLSHMKRLQAGGKTPPDHIACYWTDIDTAFYTDYLAAEPHAVPSLYEQLFVNKTLAGQVLAKDPATLTGTLSGNAPAIMAALQISADEFAMLHQNASVIVRIPDPANTSLTIIDDRLSLTNLSSITRHVFYSKSVGLPVREYLTTLELVNHTPFATTATTVLFTDQLHTIKTSPFTIEELDYLLTHRTRPGSRIAATDAVIGMLLDGMREDLRKIAADNSPSVDPGGEWAQKKLARSEQAVIQRLSEFLSIDSAIVGALLKTWITSPVQPADKAMTVFLDPAFAAAAPAIKSARAVFAVPFDTMVLLGKISLFVQRLSVTHTELPWVLGLAPSAGWLNLNKLPLTAVPGNTFFAGWERLMNLVRLRDTLPDGTVLLTNLFTRVAAGASLDELLTLLSKGTPWPLSNIRYICGVEGFNFSVTGFSNEMALLRLSAACTVLQQLGASAAQCMAWTRALVTAKEAQEAMSLVRATYDTAQWLQKAKTLRDPLRGKQRAALSAYLVTTWRVRNTDELFDDFLADVEMGTCMMTTRIRQAINSVQLFIQRCFMNLEKGVSLTGQEAEEWRQWRKQYRVWEANRKVLLYPENWIEPALRDDKSSFFQELENELLQNDVTDHTAEDAFIHYLEKLDQVARLEIAGMYKQQEPYEVLHVIGRTRAIPHIYFYRRLQDNVWTAWEKIELDIEGDHLIPVIWNRRLHLFWAIFTEKTKTLSKKERADNEDPKKQWEIKFAWSDYKQGRWTPKKVATQPLLYQKHPSPAIRQDVADFSFKTRIQQGVAGEQLSIQCYGTIVTETPVPPPPPGPVITTNTEFLNTFIRHTVLGNTAPYYIAVQFEVNGQPLGEAERQKVLVQLRKADGTSVEIIFLDSDSVARSKIKITENLDCMLVSTAYAKWDIVHRWEWIGVPGGLGIKITLKPWSPPVPATQPQPPPILTENIMQAVGEFVLDDANGNLVAVDRVQTFRPIDPTLLQPVQGTRIQNMMMVEDNNATDWLGASGLLKKTPGKFRLLLQHQTYMPRLFSFPFFYHDELCTYLVSIVSATNPVRFHTFYHPMVQHFNRSLHRYGIAGLLTLDNQLLKNAHHFSSKYDPGTLVGNPYPVEEVDFGYHGAYSLYNWELFFHAPLLVATQLSNNQQFEQAQRWFHYIFNPTATDSPSGAVQPGAERFWRVKPFYDEAMRGAQTLEELMADAAALNEQVNAWKADPFKPHVIARLRVVAYMKAVVMRYIDNLVAWGDQLFRRDTIESINEATQLYLLAAQILGRRPENIPARAIPKEQTFRTLDDITALDSLSNAVVEIESFLSPVPASGTTTGQGGKLAMPFFCIPQNEKLLGYWDTVADRLFKIRHCMNIEGIARQLAIYEPPIDPALLVRAAAAGIDIGTVLSDLNAPVPAYRFTVMVQKAVELCQDVKALGAELLAALEKKDAEKLALLRSGHEVELLTAVRQIKRKAIEEANATLEGLRKYEEVISIRQQYYQTRVYMNSFEKFHFDLTGMGILLMEAQMGAEVVAGVLHLIPETKGGAPTTVGVTYGGSNVASAVQAFGSVMGTMASIINTTASLSATQGGYQRRQEEWTHQAALATKELEQVNKQIIAAEIRLSMAEYELQNHDLQTENSQKVDAYLRDKFTNQELYSWMAGQISAIYFQTYQLAFDVAKRAEKTFRHELGLTDSNFIQFGYWDSLKKGLLAGIKLQHDLRRLDVAYLEQHKRLYEITKHVSLLRHNPLALITLKETGQCEVTLPEALFDMDYPGHYSRRIKSVSLTIPCITGPYTSINCTLTLLSSKTRVNTTANTAAVYAAQEEGHVVSSFGSIQSIATSHAQNDSGMFELDFRDERYLPFEGAGAVSTWRIEMPKDCNAFAFNTISDVVLRLHYTAREGGSGLRTAAKSALNTAIANSATMPLSRLFSLKHEFSEAFLELMGGPLTAQAATVKIEQKHFPSLLSNRTIIASEIHVFLRPVKEIRTDTAKDNISVPDDATLAISHPQPPADTVMAAKNTNWTKWPDASYEMKKVALAIPAGFRIIEQLKIAATGLKKAEIEDVLVLVKYTVTL